MARALTGRNADAIEDFEAYVQRAEGEKNVHARLGWKNLELARTLSMLRRWKRYEASNGERELRGIGSEAVRFIVGKLPA